MPVIAAVDPALAAFGGAAIAAVGAYAAAARRLSGRIETSAASDLWAEVKSQREWSAMRITELTAEVAHLEQRIDQIEARNTNLVDTIAEQRGEIADLKVKLRSAKSQASVSKEEVDELTRRLTTERRKVSELEQRA